MKDFSFEKQMPDEAYKSICRRIWELKEKIGGTAIDGSRRKAVFPPPRRGKVALLIVGQSPNHNDVPYTLHSKMEAWEHAINYEFLKRGPVSIRDKHYHPYYRKLMAFVRQVDARLAVWWEVEHFKETFLMEFCDALALCAPNKAWPLRYH